jgi:hypothetical protein
MTVLVLKKAAEKGPVNVDHFAFYLSLDTTLYHIAYVVERVPH